MFLAPDRPPHTHPPAARRQRVALAALLVGAATFVLYSGALKNDFIGWDDEFYVLANPYITPLSGPTIGAMFTHFHFKSWTPLTLLSHAIDYALWGLDPRGHHLTNMILHALNAVWMLLLSMALLRVYIARSAVPAPDGDDEIRWDAALLAGGVASALLFAWHPLRVEAVACASSRKDLLSTFLTLPALLLYIAYSTRRGMQGAWQAWAGALLLYALALLAKASVMTLPALLLIIDIMAGGFAGGWARWKRLLAEKIPFAVLGLAAAAVAYIASEGNGDMAQALRAESDYTSWELGTYNLSFYLLKSLWPARLAELYTYPKPWPFLFFSLAAPAATLLSAFFWWKGRRAWMFAWGAYVLALLPMAGFVASSIQVIANRYAYLAAAPFCVLAGGGIASARLSSGLRKKPWAFPSILGVLCLALAGLAWRTVAQMPEWRDAETVWRHTIAVSPGHALAHNELGLALLEKKDFPGAIASFARAIEIYPGFSQAMCNMGGAYVSMGDTASAERVLRAALALSPRDYATLTNLGNVRMVQRKFAEAAAFYRESLSLNPAAPVTTYDLGYALLLMGKPEDALRELRRAIRLNPNYRDAYFLTGEILARRADGAGEALAAYRRAARLGHEQAQRLLAGKGVDW